ncbi:PilN domain-containing protein [Candidatus Uhrbacteria bacterium]|nr:PilN domain-containing protein [Candidatus Uhrbacteria bacterium]
METSINLLPPSKKRELRNGAVLAYAQTMALVLFLTAAVLSGTLLSLRLTVGAEREYLEAQSAGSATDEEMETINDIRQINSFLQSSDSLQKGQVPWNDILRDIAGLMPDNARLDTFRIESNNRIFIEGMAIAREDAIDLLESLRSLPYLTNIKSPISNITQKTDVRFSFEMTYRDPETDGRSADRDL